MKKILVMMLLLAPCKLLAASTDTINSVREKVVELHITHKPDVEAMQNKHKAKIADMRGHSICSGAFVDSIGDILTARHCAANVESIEVITVDQREYAAKVVAISANHDLALIHIDEMNTPHFTLARGIQQGETVYTYGSPLGIMGTLTKGIVAKLNGDVNYVDCSVLPGNSGGPLFNEAGELVGITTAGFIVLYGTTHLNIAQSISAILFFAMSLGGHQ